MDFAQWTESVGSCGNFKYSLSTSPQLKNSSLIKLESNKVTLNLGYSTIEEVGSQIKVTLTGSLKSGASAATSFRIIVKA